MELNAESLIILLLQKMKGMLGEIMKMMMPETMAIQSVKEKLVPMMQKLVLVFMGWFDKFFPPETRTLKGMGGQLVMKLKEVRADDIVLYVQEKWKVLFPVVENCVSFSVALLGKVFPPEARTLKGVAGKFMVMAKAAMDKLREVEVGGLIHSVQEKWNEVFPIVEDYVTFSVSWLGKVFPPETRTVKGIWGEMVKVMDILLAKLKEMGADELIPNLGQKFQSFLVMLEQLLWSLMAWLDQIFPPETRKEQIWSWIKIISPYAVLGLGLLVLLWCCLRCTKIVVNIVKALCRFCWKSFKFCISTVFKLATSPFRRLKMMKAPGSGYMMPRRTFEANPKAYFRDLRARR